MFTDGQPARAARHAPKGARREQGRGPIEHVHHAQEGAGHRGIVHRRAIDLGLLSLDQAHRQRARDEAETACHLAESGWGKDDASFRPIFTTRFIPGGTPEQHRCFNEMKRISTRPENAAHFMRACNEIRQARSREPLAGDRAGQGVGVRAGLRRCPVDVGACRAILGFQATLHSSP